MNKDRTKGIVVQRYVKEFQCNKLFHDSVIAITSGPGPMVDDEICLDVISQLCKAVEHALMERHSEVRILGNIWE